MKKTLSILNTREKKDILKRIASQWGCEWETDLIFWMNTKNKIYLSTRDVETILDKRLRIDTLGLYFGEVKGEELRLSIEGSQLIGPLATRNVVDIDDTLFEEWLMGGDIHVDEPGKAFVLLRHAGDFCGCGKLKDGVVKNYVPKTRRVQEVNA